MKGKGQIQRTYIYLLLKGVEPKLKEVWIMKE